MLVIRNLESLSFSREIPQEQHAAPREKVLEQTQAEIRKHLPRYNALVEREADGPLDAAGQQQLEEVRGRLLQSFAHYELCAQRPGALRQAGLADGLRDTGLFVGVSEAFRTGADRIGDHVIALARNFTGGAEASINLYALAYGGNQKLIGARPCSTAPVNWKRVRRRGPRRCAVVRRCSPTP